MVNNDSDTTLPEESGETPASVVPAVDVCEDAQGITLWADMPGVPKDKLSIHINDNALTIEGAITLDVPPDMQAIHAEIMHARYRRVFTLSRDLDADKVDASYLNGVLRLRIPKVSQERARRIEVQVA